MANIEQNRKLMKEQMESFKKPLNEASIDMSKNPRIVFGDLYDAVRKFNDTKAKDVLGKKGLKELDEKKKMSQQISNRTTNSINQFENPSVVKGGTKTRRRLFKRKLKSKRVRFAI